MQEACYQFQRVLADLLGSSAAGRQVHPGQAGQLGWHEHLLLCDDCRALLDREHALEELLSSLPEPKLPENLVQRVLVALADARTDPTGELTGDSLDELLGVDGDLALPDGFEQRVLAGVRARAARVTGPVGGATNAVDDLLDALPEPVAEQGLEGRILNSLEQHRSPAARGWQRHVRWVPALAAVLLLAFLVAVRREDQPALDPYEQDPEFLSLLPLLEAWEPLNLSDPDVYLGELDSTDWALVIEGAPGDSDDDAAFYDADSGEARDG